LIGETSIHPREIVRLLVQRANHLVFGRFAVMQDRAALPSALDHMAHRPENVSLLGLNSRFGILRNLAVSVEAVSAVFVNLSFL